jgi:hypothetical protein
MTPSYFVSPYVTLYEGYNISHTIWSKFYQTIDIQIIGGPYLLHSRFAEVQLLLNIMYISY